MGQTHDHHHGDYYVEQLCTIGICLGLGFICTKLFLAQYGLLGVPQRKILNLLLVGRLHPFVLSGGIILLALVAVRAVAVWVAAGHLGKKPRPVSVSDHEDHPHEVCEHEHEHREACGHDAEACCGHEHAWSPWRYAVLLLPVVLFFLDHPNESYATLGSKGVKVGEVSSDVGAVADTGVDFQVGFQELERAAYTSESRNVYQGKTVELIGQYVPGANDWTFGLVRYKMNCCAADAIPLSALTMLDRSSTEKLPADLGGKWVKVQGQVQFRERRDRPGIYLTVVLVRPTAERPLSKLVEKIGQPDSYFLY